MQYYAQKAIREHLKKLQTDLKEHWKIEESRMHGTFINTGVWKGCPELIYDGVLNSTLYRDAKENGYTEDSIRSLFDIKKQRGAAVL